MVVKTFESHPRAKEVGEMEDDQRLVFLGERVMELRETGGPKRSRGETEEGTKGKGRKEVRTRWRFDRMQGI